MQETQCFKEEDSILKIDNSSYAADIYKYKDYMAFTRKQEIVSKKYVVDVFVPNAMIAVADDIQKNIFLNIFGIKIKLDNASALYVPPLCPIKWEIEPQTFIWKAFFGTPKEAHPLEPFLFKRDDLTSFLSGEVVKGNRFEYFKKIPYVSLKVKEYIDSNFTKECHMEKMAEEVKISKFTISHYFKKTFGFSALSYRNLLRTSYCHYLLLEKRVYPQKVSEASGFIDYSRFFINFKRNFKSSPKEFTSRKNNAKSNIALQ